MRVLLMHNRYVWPGGEDRGVDEQARVLREHGHEVELHLADNRDAVGNGRVATGLAMLRGAWSRRAYAAARAAIGRYRPDLVHVHNFWFRFSPSVLAAAAHADAAVVLTLHNFRLLCPAGVFLDARGKACRRCVGRLPWPGILKRCYHRSFLASSLVAWMITLNRLRGTWRRCVDLLLVPSEFCSRQLQAGLGLHPVVCPPGVPVVTTPPEAAGGEPATRARGGGQAAADIERTLLFVGRLSPEKGLHTLLDAWPEIERRTGAGLLVVGEGPLFETLRTRARGMRVRFPGRQAAAEVEAMMRACSALVLPSECYETFGRVVVEAYAQARPVLVSDLGGPAGLVDDGETGLLFRPGSPADLADKACALLADPDRARRMGAAGRERYERDFTPAVGYERLLRAYRQALARGAQRRGG